MKDGYVARGRTISQRLTLMNMLVSGVALVLACAVFLTYDLMTTRQGMVDSLSTQAQIIGSNSVAALLFNDPDSAAKTLSAMRTSPNVVMASIATPEGKTFATYQREPGNAVSGAPAIPPEGTEAHSFSASEVALARRIEIDGQPAGIVYIRSDVRALRERLVRYLSILTAVLFFSMLAALFVSSLTKRAISEPIVRLAETAQIVSQRQDFSVRVPRVNRGGEVSVLVDGFNEMLSQIEARDEALHKAHDELEKRVAARTAELAAANRELEAFSYSVSHDLRAPLRHIDGFSAILASKYGSKLDPPAQRYLSMVREGATKMGELIDDLLKMGRVTRQELVRSSIDFDALLQSTIDDLRPEFQEREIEWRVARLPRIDCDPSLMRVVLVNLLSNAVKYTRRAERPIIEVGQMKGECPPVFFVRDNGAGFEQQYAHKLFGVFQRLHRSEDFEGTGVGLATVQRIIHKHGGEIWAEGVLDKGATFFFTLGTGGQAETAPGPVHSAVKA